MLRMFMLFNAMTLSIGGSIAQAVPMELPDNPNDQTLLWEVSGGGLSQPSYFLGTMHILCPEDAYLSVSLMKILDGAKSVYLEMDLDNMALMLGAMKAMNMRNDTTLADLLKEDELNAVKAYFGDKLPLPFQMLQRYKPMLLSGMMAEQMLPCKAGMGTEAMLMAETKKRKLAIEGLETPAFQAGLFDSIPYVQQAQELLKAIQETNVQSDMAEKMVEAYRQQDLKSLEDLTISSEGGMSAYLDLLLYGRNRNWVAKFPDIASGGPILFAVGAGHLPGENGVLNLLKLQGYTLRPLLNVKPPMEQ